MLGWCVVVQDEGAMGSISEDEDEELGQDSDEEEYTQGPNSTEKAQGRDGIRG